MSGAQVNINAQFFSETSHIKTTG